MHKVLAAVVGCLLMSACATVTRGSKDAWEVDTQPSGARVETSNGHLCPSTPCAIKMSRKSEFTATVTKPGYKDAHISVTHKTAGAGAAGVAGNVLVGGLIGLGVDMATGASQDLTPNPAHVVMERLDPPVVAEAKPPEAAPAVAVASPAAATPAAAAPAAAAKPDEAVTRPAAAAAPAVTPTVAPTTSPPTTAAVGAL